MRHCWLFAQGVCGIIYGKTTQLCHLANIWTSAQNLTLRIEAEKKNHTMCHLHTNTCDIDSGNTTELDSRLTNS